ncbi:MAG: hypothetical protein UHU19_03560 [Lachnospiraceae bacterium]|nr:hypothetical protein [Lachnospiraceae bacterium]
MTKKNDTTFFENKLLDLVPASDRDGTDEWIKVKLPDGAEGYFFG